MKRVVNFKSIGLALLVSLFALNISAQGPGRGFQMTEEDIKENVDNTAKTLKLNDEQHKKALAVEMDFYNKMQIEFNPLEVASYRMIGYENRLLEHEDFNDDKVNAADVGAGHSITVLYELVPHGLEASQAKVDALKYQQASQPSRSATGGDLLTVKLRYKNVGKKRSKWLEFPVREDLHNQGEPSDDLRFAAAVAAFGMKLRKSEYTEHYSMDEIDKLATTSLGYDPNGYRDGFLDLIQMAKDLMEKEKF